MMLSPQEIESNARPGAAFSNGTEWSCWEEQWCGRCAHDLNKDEGGCPILLVALLGEQTPQEWVPGSTDDKGYPSLPQRYRCVEFVEADFA